MSNLYKQVRCVAGAALVCLSASALSAQIGPGISNPGTVGSTVAESPDVTMYGAASGQLQEHHSRVQVFGFATPGATVEAQVVGARPHVAATFVLSAGWLDFELPGIGTLLVDPGGAIEVQAVTDADGFAAVPLTVPADVAVGAEFYIQCKTVDTTATPALELSSAAVIQVGAAAKPIGMTSTLEGTATVEVPGVATVTAATDGLLTTETRLGAGGVIGEVSVHAESDAFSINGIPFTDLHVCPGAGLATIPWESGDYLSAPAGTPDEFLLSYSVLGVDYGPYAVPATYSLSLGRLTVELPTLPIFDGHPLAGSTIHYELEEELVGTEQFAALEGLAVQLAVAGDDLTDGDVDPIFVAMRAAFAARRAQLGPRGFLEGELPTYKEFLAAEAVALRSLTDGAASNDTELHALIQTGAMTEDEGFAKLLLGKIAAIFDLEDETEKLLEVFKDQCGGLANEAKEQIGQGKRLKCAKTCIKIMQKLTSKSFLNEVAEELGAELVEKLAKKIGSKCLPVIGWALTAKDVASTLIQQWL